MSRTLTAARTRTASARTSPPSSRTAVRAAQRLSLASSSCAREPHARRLVLSAQRVTYPAFCVRPSAGNVVKVRIPTFPDTGAIKGFAFVEFDSAVRSRGTRECLIPSFAHQRRWAPRTGARGPEASLRPPPRAVHRTARRRPGRRTARRAPTGGTMWLTSTAGAGAGAAGAHTEDPPCDSRCSVSQRKRRADQSLRGLRSAPAGLYGARLTFQEVF